MDIYILDDMLRSIDVVDEYISFIWTERWNEMGDFELVTLSSPGNRHRFFPDVQITIPQSNHVMIIETVEETVDIDNGGILKIKGRDLISIFDKRVAIIVDDVTTQVLPSWNNLTLSPKELMLDKVSQICFDSTFDPADNLPYLQDPLLEETLYPPDGLPEPMPGGVEWTQKPMSLYAAIKQIADAYDLGFRLYRDPNFPKIYFNVSIGNDRTSAQTTLPPIIFSQDMVNLIDTTEFIDYSKHFNAVQVIYFYKDEFDEDATISIVVEAPEVAFSTGGFQRKVKLLPVTQVPEGIALLGDYLVQLGNEELVRSRPVDIYDGEIDKNATYVYGQDYFLGDILEVRGSNGGAAYMRAVEQIFKSDGSGDSSYPTLVTKTSITPGTWASWKYNIEWEDVASTEFWNNQ